MDSDREYIIAEIQRVALELGTDTLPRSTFKSNSNVSEWQILKHFENWNEAVEAAGLKPILDFKRIDDDTLFQEMLSVFIQNGGICTRTKFDKLCKYSADVYKRHFGRWDNVLLAFREWLGTSGESFPYIDQLPKKAEAIEPTSVTADSKYSYSEPTTKGTVYGRFLNFRGLQHEPINEQGVVFLFGMVCFELGFAVEAVQTGYPDCEAKRRIKNKRGEWQKVRVEFEYRSCEFRNHGHNPDDCDIIVCWIHDWKACPLEVLELRTAIKELEE